MFSARLEKLQCGAKTVANYGVSQLTWEVKRGTVNYLQSALIDSCQSDERAGCFRDNREDDLS
ncbi:hypothetical protein SAMN05444415_106197 [Salipiger profundus]|jgi:hypothetical protein|nr:hypothetical protein SAMN05444415_106197 [Salipiger profundus]